MRGIDADGIKEDIFAHSIAEHLLHLRQPRGFQRTRILRSGIDKVNDHDLALDQIVIEMDLVAVLRGENSHWENSLRPSGHCQRPPRAMGLYQMKNEAVIRRMAVSRESRMNCPSHMTAPLIRNCRPPCILV